MSAILKINTNFPKQKLLCSLFSHSFKEVKSQNTWFYMYLGDLPSTSSSPASSSSLKLSTLSASAVGFRTWNTEHQRHSLCGKTITANIQISVPVHQGSHSFNSKKFQDFSRTPRTFFQDVVAAQQYWNIKANGRYLLKIYNVAA